MPVRRRVAPARVVLELLLDVRQQARRPEPKQLIPPAGLNPISTPVRSRYSRIIRTHTRLARAALRSISQCAAPHAFTSSYIALPVAGEQVRARDADLQFRRRSW